MIAQEQIAQFGVLDVEFYGYSLAMAWLVMKYPY
jgi:hypothetical protein